MKEKIGVFSRIGLLLALLLFLAGIAYVSNQPASEQDMKKQIRAHAWIVKTVDRLPQMRINYEGHVVDSRQDPARFIQFGIRKVVHFAAYGFMGLLVLWNLSAGKPRTRSHYLLAGAAVLAIAILDEWHQLSVPGRCGLVYDVVVDMAGYVTFGGLCYLLNRRQVGQGDRSLVPPNG